MKELYTQVSSVALVIGLGSFLLIWSNIDFLFSFLKPEFKAGIWLKINFQSIRNRKRNWNIECIDCERSKEWVFSWL